MQSKTSFCNVSLLVHFLRRFWPLALAVFVVVVFDPGLGIVAEVRSYTTELERSVAGQEVIYMAARIMVPLMAGAACIASLLVFRHVHDQQAIQFYHGLPVSRLCLFVTASVAGLLLIAAPLLAGLGVCFGLSAIVGLPGLGGDLAKLAAVSLECLLLFFGMAALSSVLAGRSLGSILIYVGMNFALAVIAFGYAVPMGVLLPGVYVGGALYTPVEWLTPVLALLRALMPNVNFYYLGPTLATDFSQPHLPAIYALVGIALLVVAGTLYCIRPAEATGETVAFQPVRSLCKAFAALVVSAAGSFVVMSLGIVPAEASLVGVLVIVLSFAFLGWFAAEMIVQRSLRVFDKKAFAHYGALALALCAGVALLHADVLGWVSYIPPSKDIEQATVDYRFGTINMQAEDAQRIHQAVLDHRDSLVQVPGTYAYTSLNLHYTLKDGADVQRIYMLPYEDTFSNTNNAVLAEIAQVLERPDYAKQAFFNEGADALSAQHMDYAIISYSEDNPALMRAMGLAQDSQSSEDPGESFSLDFSAKEAYDLYLAICQDIEERHLSIYDMDELNSGQIELIWHNPYHLESGEETHSGVYRSEDGEMWGTTYSAGIPLTPRMVHTLDEIARVTQAKA